MQAKQVQHHTQEKTNGNRDRISSVRSTPKRQNSNGAYLLDTSEISVLGKRESKLRTKAKVAKAYRDSGHIRKAEKVEHCGRQITVEQTKCEHRKQRLQTFQTCKDRLCPICARKEAQRKGRIYSELIHVLFDQGEFEYAYLVTLTYKNVFSLTDKGYSQYVKEVKQFRKEIEETFHVYGGLVSFEVTQGKDGLFHPHFHLLILSNRSLGTKTNRKGQTTLNYHWMNYVSQTWSGINGGSGYITDARPFDLNSDQSVNEVVKYATKALDSMPSEMLTDFIAFSRNRRFVIAFGGLYGKKDLYVKQDETDGSLVCNECGCTDTFLTKMILNNAGTRYVLDMPSNVYPLNQVRRE